MTLRIIALKQKIINCMKREVLFSIMLLLGVGLYLPAQNTETLYLNDDSVLKGYIKEQVPGNNIIFHSDDVDLKNGRQKSSNSLYDIKWSDISFIEKEDMPDTLLTGTISEVILNDDNSYTGFIIELHPGDFIKLKDENDKIHVVRYSNIRTINTKILNHNQALEEQFYYLDEIVLKDEGSVKGFIVKQSVGKSISVWVDETETVNIPLNDIAKLRKQPNNTFYKPIWDKILQEGQFVYNNSDIVFQDIKPTVQGLYIVDVKQNVLTAELNKEISVYANLIDDETKMTAIKTVRMEDRANLIGNKKNYYETFKMDDFVSSNIEVKKSNVTKGGTTEFSFTPTETGYYVLYVSSEEGYIVFKVI